MKRILIDILIFIAIISILLAGSVESESPNEIMWMCIFCSISVVAFLVAAIIDNPVRLTKHLFAIRCAVMAWAYKHHFVCTENSRTVYIASRHYKNAATFYMCMVNKYEESEEKLHKSK